MQTPRNSSCGEQKVHCLRCCGTSMCHHLPGAPACSATSACRHMDAADPGPRFPVEMRSSTWRGPGHSACLCPQMDLLDTLLSVPPHGRWDRASPEWNRCILLRVLQPMGLVTSCKVKKGFLPLMLVLTKKWQKKTFPNFPPPIPLNRESKIRKDNNSRNLCVCVE